MSEAKLNQILHAEGKTLHRLMRQQLRGGNVDSICDEARIIA